MSGMNRRMFLGTGAAAVAGATLKPAAAGAASATAAAVPEATTTALTTAETYGAVLGLTGLPLADEPRAIVRRVSAESANLPPVAQERLREVVKRLASAQRELRITRDDPRGSVERLNAALRAEGDQAPAPGVSLRVAVAVALDTALPADRNIDTAALARGELPLSFGEALPQRRPEPPQE